VVHVEASSTCDVTIERFSQPHCPETTQTVIHSTLTTKCCDTGITTATPYP